MLEQHKKERFINIDEVINRTSLKKTTIYTLIKKKAFPEPVGLGVNRKGWLESEINQWIATTIETNRKE